MNEKHLHIVALDTPWPADYGGAIDMYYRIVALSKIGVKVHLHYFSYNERKDNSQLSAICYTIHVYQRKKGHTGFLPGQPYIVTSRNNQELSDTLKKDEHPILLEGVHCTGLLKDLDPGKRKIMVRLHNDEAAYYKQLANNTTHPLRKIYYEFESRWLKKYQSHLPPGVIYACISRSDVDRYKNIIAGATIIYLPAFTPYQEIKSEEGMGNFCLYHGNLSVAENDRAARWLLTHVFPKIKVPLVVAGKNPSSRLDKLAHLCQHTCLVSNPAHTELNDLIRKAHINIIPSFSTTGIKIKLLHALAEGRHCITNEDMVAGTGLEPACHIGNGANAMAAIIMQLHHQPFTREEILLRERLFGNSYDNTLNAQTITRYLW